MGAEDAFLRRVGRRRGGGFELGVDGRTVALDRQGPPGVTSVETVFVEERRTSAAAEKDLASPLLVSGKHPFVAMSVGVTRNSPLFFVGAHREQAHDFSLHFFLSTPPLHQQVFGFALAVLLVVVALRSRHHAQECRHALPFFSLPFPSLPFPTTPSAQTPSRANPSLTGASLPFFYPIDPAHSVRKLVRPEQRGAGVESQQHPGGKEERLGPLGDGGPGRRAGADGAGGPGRRRSFRGALGARGGGTRVGGGWGTVGSVRLRCWLRQDKAKQEAQKGCPVLVLLEDLPDEGGGNEREGWLRRARRRPSLMRVIRLIY